VSAINNSGYIGIRRGIPALVNEMIRFCEVCRPDVLFFKGQKRETNWKGMAKVAVTNNARRNTSQRTNREWLNDLAPPANEKALHDLRNFLLKGLSPALVKYKDRELYPFTQDVAQDALLKILDNLDSFRGDSMFTTWAMKIAIREGLSELRRKKWQDISIQSLIYDPENEGLGEINSLIFSSNNIPPDQQTHEHLILAMVLRIINTELSKRQKMALLALKVHQVPISVVAEQMGIKRNALYKLVHDARVKLKQRLYTSGIDAEKLFRQM